MTVKTPAEMLACLARIDSPSGHETAFFDYISGFLQEMSFSIQYDDYGNMVAYRRAKNNYEPILFAFHGDKVSNGNEIEAIIEDGYVVSNGMNSLGADNKAAIACLISVLKQRDFDEPVEILITRMEEEGFIGARNLDRTMIKANVGVTMDGGCVGEVTLSSKYWTSIAMKSDNRKDEVEEELKKWATQNNYEIWFTKNACTGYDVEMNLLTCQSDNDEIVEEILRQAKSTRQKVTRKCPGFNIPLDHDIVKIALSSILDLGVEPKIVNDDISPEVCVLNSKGILCINLGDGVINEHELNEKVLISDLEKNCAIISNILDKYKHRTTAST